MEIPLAESLAMADGVALGPVSRAQLLSDAERLSPERVAAKIEALGRSAAALANAEGVAEYLAGVVEPGDIVLVMSNGSFDGLLGKLNTRLSKARPPEKITRQ
jgi:UDP-N-acetylmuramate: L-alanyl-gamma-D-glutamyl-meso-diaminopimelate ligase